MEIAWESEKFIQFWLENLKRRDCMIVLGINGKKMCKRI
jgi:uncharacterized protein YpiB (UPF0302 family)